MGGFPDNCTLLSREDFETFSQQVKHGRQSPKVSENSKEGLRMADEFQRTGRVVLGGFPDFIEGDGGN